MSCPVRVTATFQKQAYGVEVTFSLQQISRTLRTKKRVTLIRPAVAGRQLTAIMKADRFTCTTPLHERSRSAETY